MQFDRGRYASLIKKCENMLQCDEENISAHFCLARVFHRTGEYDLAMLHGKKVLKLNPREINASLNLGLIYESLNFPKRAAACYKKELKLNPSNGPAHYNFAYLYFERNQWKRASIHFEECIRFKFRFNEEYMMHSLGTCYYKRNDVKNYIRVYSDYFEREPTLGWVAVNLAGALLDVGRLCEAQDMMKKAEHLGENPRFKDKLQKKILIGNSIIQS